MKKSNIIQAVLVAFILCCGTTYAYLSDADTVKNTATIGSGNISIVEDFNPPPNITPGTTYTKNVRIENDGPSDCFVRVKAVFTDSDIGDYCEVDWNDADWVYNSEDGYYYYPNLMEAGDITESLFTTVKIKNTIPQDNLKSFDILVYAESCPTKTFTDYQEAWDDFQINK